MCHDVIGVLITLNTHVGPLSCHPGRTVDMSSTRSLCVRSVFWQTQTMIDWLQRQVGRLTDAVHVTSSDCTITTWTTACLPVTSHPPAIHVTLRRQYVFGFAVRQSVHCPLTPTVPLLKTCHLLKFIMWLIVKSMNIQRLFLSLSLAVSHWVWLIDESCGLSMYVRCLYATSRSAFGRVTTTRSTVNESALRSQQTYSYLRGVDGCMA